MAEYKQAGKSEVSWLRRIAETVVIAGLAAILAGCICVTTPENLLNEHGLGFYNSHRQAELEELHKRIIVHPDGTMTYSDGRPYNPK